MICLYCEAAGQQTELIRVGHWGLCPVHSADYLARISLPTPAEQIQKVVGGLLKEVGRPTIGGAQR